MKHPTRMTQEELLDAIVALETKHRAYTEPPFEEQVRLRRLKVALTEIYRHRLIEDEQRNTLRLRVDPVSVVAEVQLGDDQFELSRCYDFGVGGLFFRVSPPPMVGSTLKLLSVTVGKTTFPLGVTASVIWTNARAASDSSGLPVGCGVQFCELGEAQRKRIHDVFDCLLDELAGYRTFHEPNG